MKITRLTIRYEELKSGAGYNNQKAAIELSAELEPKDDPVKVRQQLFAIAKYAVKKELGLDVSLVEVDKSDSNSPTIELD